MSESEWNDLEDLIRQSAEFPSISTGVRCRILRVADRARTRHAEQRRLPLVILAGLLLTVGVTYSLQQTILFAVHAARSAAPPMVPHETSLGQPRASLGAGHEWRDVDNTVGTRDSQLQRLLRPFWQ
jgi:hypothetical protein